MVPGVCWNIKSVEKLCTLTCVLYQAVDASVWPPSVRRRRVPLSRVFPTSVIPEELKPPLKLIEFGALGAIVYRPLATELLVRVDAVAIALSVEVVVMDTGPEYTLLEVVGVEPSVV